MFARRFGRLLLIGALSGLVSKVATAHPGHDHAAPDGLSASRIAEPTTSVRPEVDRGRYLQVSAGIVILALAASSIFRKPTMFPRHAHEYEHSWDGWRRVVLVTALTLVGAVFGGGSSVVVAWFALRQNLSLDAGERVAYALTAVLGSVAAGGGVVGLAKLGGGSTGRRAAHLPGHRTLMLLTIAAVVGLSSMLVRPMPGGTAASYYAGTTILAFGIGAVHFAARRGEDAPIIGAILFAAGGLAAIGAGYIVRPGLPMIVGALMAAAGIALARVVAMRTNRPVVSVLLGAARDGNSGRNP